MKYQLLAGTYTEKGSEGIYSFSMEDGILSEAKLFCRIRDPKYLCVKGDRAAAVGSFEGGSGAALLDAEGNILDSIVFESSPSCYILWRDDRIYCANYHEGHVNVLEEKDGKLTHLKTLTVREKAGCHQVIVHAGKILVPCLLIDRVKIFDEDLKEAGEIVFEEGTGPRHGIVTEDGKYLYLASELSNELFEIETAGWTVCRRISVLPEGRTHEKDTAAIRFSEDEKYIYVSTRTRDIISVIERAGMKLIQTVSCGGEHPRDILRVGDHLLAANRFTDDVVSFHLEKDGTVGEITGRTRVIQAVSLDVIGERG